MVQFFLKKSVVTICLNLSILLIGFFSIEDIANEFIPAIEIPAVGVVFPTTFLHHDKVIHDVIAPVERKLLATGDVEKIETTLDRDRVILFIFYKWSIRPEDCLQRARQVVNSVGRPKGVLDPLFVLHRPTISPIYRVAFTGKDVKQLTSQVQALAGQLERQQGVAEVRVMGGQPQKGVLQVDPVEAARNKVSIQNIISSAYNTWSFRQLFSDEKNDSSINYLKLNLNNIEDFKELSVVNSRKDVVPLKWFTQIYNANDPPQVLYGAGKDAVILEVIKAPGSDALSIVDKAKLFIDRAVQSDTSLNTTVVYDEADKIRKAQAGVLQNFATGVFFNSIVLIIFLGSIIGAVVASCVFPTAILGTLYILKVSDISLNIFALNGFSLASGMITDASIVVLESIMRRFQKGQELNKSCDKGTKDVMIGVFASTLTTAAVILPISMQDGVSSKLFSDLGIVLVTTQFISLIAVFTFVPWLCSKILSDEEVRPAPIEYLFGWSTVLVNSMTKLAAISLNKAAKSVKVRYAIPSIATAISLICILFLPNSEFLPAVSSKIYSLTIPIKRIKLMEEGYGDLKKIAKIVGEEKDVAWAVSSMDDDSLKVIFEIKNQDVIQKVKDVIIAELKVPESRIITLAIGPTPSSEPMSYDGYYYLRSDIDPEKKQAFIEKFCKSPGIYDCNTEKHYYEPSNRLKPNILSLTQGGTNVFESTMNVAALTKGLDLASLANLAVSFPVELRFPENFEISNFPFLIGKHHDKVSTLNSLYESNYQLNQNVLFRRDGNNYVPLYFRIKGITIGQAVTSIDQLKKDLNINEKQVIPMGTIETMNETFEKMINALILSAILILLVLVIQFKSFFQAIVIMYSMPLSLGGAIIGLLLMGETLNVGVIVGFILLIGIIVNNGILLMDAINQRLTAGMEILEAVLESVESRTRPILMTTFSTVFGMLPTLVLEAEGKELYQGMAIVNIFGMIFGTILTLVVTPIVIKMILDWEHKKKSRVAQRSS